MANKLNLLFRVLVIATLMQFGTISVIGQPNVTDPPRPPPPKVPCTFVFGDSLVDDGNNNDLNTRAKFNYAPYGIDFPGRRATGRATNGRTIADFITQLLGLLGFIPPYATVTDEQIPRGVNYGSGGAGILDDTGRKLGDRIDLNHQLLRHAIIVSRLKRLQGNDKTFTEEYLKKCIYLVDIGSNDYINNYFMPNDYIAGRIYTPPQFASKLIEKYSQQLKKLYDLGARKIAVFGVGLLGCTPFERARYDTKGAPCVEPINNAVKLFNDQLPPLVDGFNRDYPGASFTFINMTSISTPLEGDPPLSFDPCCPTNSDGLCIQDSMPCPNRDMTAFFDDLHPTQVANGRLAARSYKKATPMDARPFDISQLAEKP
ncbi:hypothetical protein R6Q59_002103 [Mikania micrantha]|uniref:SGNH hydrolase-type esterase domain-containing protein n=1 Tax=Mikania micrantha TaxID=192012 RepID=A0A5N6NP27_9ASTR|nr:hypothetical protein E3N88_19176 [Mikania micrantha]